MFFNPKAGAARREGAESKIQNHANRHLALRIGAMLGAGALLALSGTVQAADVYVNNTTPQTSGIQAAATGSDAVIVTNSAAVSGNTGIVASSDTGAISITSTANVTSLLSFAYGISATSSGGSVDIGGANGLSGAVSGIYVANSGTGTITITTGSGGDVTGSGISVRTISSAGATRINIGRGSTVTGQPFAIYAQGQEVTVTNEGTVIGSVIALPDGLGTPRVFTFNNSGALVLGGSNTVGSLFTFNNLAGGLVTGTRSLLGAANAQAGSVILVGDRSLATPAMGVMSIASLTMTSGAKLDVRADGSGSTNVNDKLIVTGAADITGGTLRVLASPQTNADWSSAKSFTVLSAGTLTGNFANTETDYAFLTVTSAKSGNDIIATLERTASFGAYSTTPNQKSVSDTFDRFQTQGSNPLIAKVTTLTATQAPIAMSQLSGAGVAVARTQSFGAGTLFSSALDQELTKFTGAASGASALSYADDRKLTKAFDKIIAKPAEPILDGRVWMQVLGGVANMKSDATNPSERATNFGLAAGADTALTPIIRAGFALSGGQSSSKVASLGTKADAVWGQAALYGVATDGALYAKAALVYSYLSTQTERTVTAFSTPETAKGKFGANLFSTRLEVGQKFLTGGPVNVTPFFAFEPSWLVQNAYSETGAATVALGYGKTVTHALPATLGMKFDAEIALDFMRVIPSATVGWVHNFADTASLSPFFTALPGSTFTVAGAKGDRNLARTELNFEATPTGSTATFYANARADLGARTTAVRGTAGAMLRF